MADVKKIKVVIGADSKELDKGVNKAGKTVDKFGKQVQKLGGLIAGAFAVDRIARFGKEAIKLAAEMEGVEMAFNNLGRPGLLNELQKATRNTVDNLTLMKLAVQAKNFKIPLEQLATFFDFATSRAIQTGESVDYLVNSIITGIGRKSVLVMDNLGISAVELQEEVKKVGDFGLAAGNIIQRAIEEAGNVVDTTATKLARLTTSWTNFKITFGQAFTESGFGGSVLRTLDRLTKLFGDTGDTEAVVKFMEFFKTISDKDVATQVGAIGDRIETIRGEIEKTAKRFRHFQDLADEAKRGERKLLQESADIILEQNGRNVALLRVYELQLSALKDINTEVDAVLPKLAKLLSGQDPEGFEAFFSRGHKGDPDPHPRIGRLDFTGDPRVKDSFLKVAEMAKHMREQTDAWLEEMHEDINTDILPDVAKVNAGMEKLGTTIGVQLVMQFANLGDAIGRALSGAEDAMNSLGQAILQNVGNILMMAGITSGNIGLVVAGAAIQLGSGIWRGMQGGQAQTAVSPSNNMQFFISGNGLATQSRRYTTFKDIVT